MSDNEGLDDLVRMRTPTPAKKVVKKPATVVRKTVNTSLLNTEEQAVVALLASGQKYPAADIMGSLAPDANILQFTVFLNDLVKRRLVTRESDRYSAYYSTYKRLSVRDAVSQFFKRKQVSATTRS